MLFAWKEERCGRAVGRSVVGSEEQCLGDSVNRVACVTPSSPGVSRQERGPAEIRYACTASCHCHGNLLTVKALRILTEGKQS